MKNSLSFVLLLFICQGAISQQTIRLDGFSESYFAVKNSRIIDSPASFLPFFEGRTIVGLGEATHGTREFYSFKCQLIKQLISYSHYRLVIFESSFGSMLYINEFIKGGAGNIDSLLQRNQYWMLYTPEVKDLLLWIRNYNTSKSGTDQVQVFGMDILASGSSLRFLFQTLRANYPALRPDVDSIFDPLQSFMQPAGQKREMPSTDQVLFQIASLENWISNHFASDPQLQKLYSLCLANVQQEFAKNRTQPSFRDSCMAANVVSLARLFPRKAIVWAHNLHVSMKDSLVNYEFAAKPMGEFLQQTFKDQYFPIGLFQNQGEFVALEQKKRKNGFEYPYLKVFSFKKPDPGYLTQALFESGESSFFPQIDRSSSAFWTKFYKVYLSGATFFPKKNNTFYITPKLAFKGLVVFQHGTAASQIDDHFYKTLN